MKKIILNKNEPIDIDGRITLTIEDGEAGEVMISIEASDAGDGFFNDFISPENRSIDLEKIMTHIQAYRESKGGKDK